MPETKSLSSSPDASDRLIRVPLERIHPHPLNPNLMDEEGLETLARNIEREGRYPPLIVRSHPDRPEEYQLLNGEQRRKVLRQLGHEDAVCYPWPCDEETALVLLATLNRLHGEELPAKRAELLRELTDLIRPEDLALLLPESAAAIADTLALLDLDSDRLLAQLTAAAAQAEGRGPRLLSFAVLREDEPDIESALTRAGEGLTGPNRRGRALALIARHYLES